MHIFLKRQMGYLREGNDGAGSGAGSSDGGAGGGQGSEGGSAPTWDSYYGGLDDQTKGLLDSHVQGLKNGLDAERSQRKDLEKQIKDLQGKAEKGSELEQSLAAMSQKLEQESLRADFYEEASKAGVKNTKLAFITAQAEGLFDSRGRCNWDALKTQFPELFGAPEKKPGGGDAGSGAGQNQGGNMNAFIRQAAGRS